MLARLIGIAAVPTWIDYAVTFSWLTFAVAGTFALAVGRAARTPHLGRRALATAAVASLVFALVVLLLDPLPGWHVGGGQQAMPKVTLVANVVAGTIGGATCFLLLTGSPTGSPGSRHGDG